MVDPASDKVPRASPYLGGCPTKCASVSDTGLSPSVAGLPMPFSYPALFSLREVLHVPPDNSCYPPLATACTLHQGRFGLFPLRSPLLRESRLISSPPGTEMVQFPGSRFTDLLIQSLIPDRSGGLPHSAINGSLDMCSSPSLLAACHGLRRPASPRHPPCALSRLTIFLCTLLYLFTLNNLLFFSQKALPFPQLSKKTALKRSRVPAFKWR